MPDSEPHLLERNATAGGWGTLGLAVLAALAAGALTGWAAHRAGGDGATEGVFLAALAATVMALLAPATLRSRQRAAPIAWCVVLLAAAVAQVGITDAPLRAATVGALLAVAIAAAWLDLVAGDGTRTSVAGGRGTELATLLPLCVATQVLARGTVVVEAGDGALAAARTLLELIGLPALAALAAAALPRSRDGQRIDTASLALLATAVVAGRFHASMVAALVVFALLPRVLEPHRTALQRLLFATPVVVALVLRPAAVVVAVAAVLALTTRRGWPAVLLVASAVLLWLEPPRTWDETLAGPVLLVTLLPLAIAAVVPGGGVPWTRTRQPAPDPRAGPLPVPGVDAGESDQSPLFVVAAALLLALVSLRALEPRVGLVAPALLLVLGVRFGARAAPRLAQTAWLALLLALGMAAQALPWARTPGAGDLLALLGWRGAPGAVLAAVTLALVLLARSLAARADRSALLTTTPQTPSHAITGTTALLPWLLPAAMASVLLFPAARAGNGTAVLVWPPQTLTAERPAFVAAFEPRAWPRTLVLDTALSHAGTLPAGTPVARVRLRRAAGGEPFFERDLRIGADTGEWAAGAPHLRDAPAPPPYLRTIPEGADFFAQRYRAVLASGASAPTTAPDGEPLRLELSVERVASLQPAVTITLFSIHARGGAGQR